MEEAIGKRTTAPLDPSRMEALLESAQLLHSSLNLDELLRHLLRSVMGRLLVGRGVIAVEEDGLMRLALVRGTSKLATGDLFDEAAAKAAGLHLLLPIGDAERPLGMLGLSQPPSKAIDPGEMEFLKALLGIAAGGIANARAHSETRQLNQALGQKVQELRALLDLVRGFIGTLEPENVAQMLGLTLAGRWAVRKYAIAAWREGHPTVLRQKGLTLPPLEDYRSVLNDLPESVVVDDLPAGDFKEALAGQQAVLILPLRSSDTTTGLVVLGARSGKLPYSEADREFAAGLVGQAVVALENSWYFRETLERRRLEQELALAASIQQGLFPADLPNLAGCEVAARNRPALQCGGDYYDALPTGPPAPDRPYLFCVADVSGKGLPASLLMSNMQANLRALLGRVPSLVELAALTNELLYATTPANKYVTAILAQVDPATGAGRFVNAGHNDCILLRADGQVEWLKSTGTPLGLLPGYPYEEGGFELRPGDLLALFSDGVPEAYDEAENEWGEERLVACLRACQPEPAPAIVAKVIEEIDRFAGAAPQHDDITLFVLKRTG